MLATKQYLREFGYFNMVLFSLYLKLKHYVYNIKWKKVAKKKKSQDYLIEIYIVLQRIKSS